MQEEKRREQETALSSLHAGEDMHPEAGSVLPEEKSRAEGQESSGEIIAGELFTQTVSEEHGSDPADSRENEVPEDLSVPKDGLDTEAPDSPAETENQAGEDGAGLTAARTGPDEERGADWEEPGGERVHTPEEQAQDAQLGELLDQESHEDKDDEDEEKLERPDYESEIIRIIKSGLSPKAAREKLEDYHENDIAEVLQKLTVADRRKLYHFVTGDMLSDIFDCLDEDDAGEYLNELDVRMAARIISGMEADTAVAALRRLDKVRRDAIIALMDEDSKRDVLLLASFDEDEIGSRMTTNFVVIRENLSIKGAMRSLVAQAAENDNISKIYVWDENKTYYGAIDLKDLIIAREGTKLDDVVVTSYPYVYGTETIDDCIEVLKSYSEDSIPVLNNSNQIIGVITAQDIIEVVDEEMGEDYARLAGLTAEEDLEEPVVNSMKKRLPWLLVLMVLGVGISAVVGVFEAVVSQLTIIMTFQSMILDMAGNVGTQSLAVTIRVLMDENLSVRQKFQLVGKEMRVGFGNGLILGFLSFILIGLFVGFVKGRGAGFGFAVSGCLGIALLVAMLVSSLTGTTIPLVFKKLGVDPAVASGPLITTINDLVAIVVYYGLSWILLLNLLHLA